MRKAVLSSSCKALVLPALLATLAATSTPASPAGPVQSSGSGAEVGQGVGAAVAVDEPEVGGNGIAPEARDELLGPSWDETDDVAYVVLSEVDGLSVMGASAATGYEWNTVVKIQLQSESTDLWISNQCLTSDGKHMVLVYAPRAVTNDEDGMAGGASALAIDLSTGVVANLGDGYSIAYFNPGCGQSDTVALARYEDGFQKTRLAVYDVGSNTISSTIDVDEMVASPISLDDGSVIGVTGEGISLLSADATTTQLVDTPGAAYGLAIDSGGQLAYLTRDAVSESATVYVTPSIHEPSRPTAIASGPVTEIGIERAVSGGFFLVGQSLEVRDDIDDTITRVPEARPDAVLSSTGRLVVEGVTPEGFAPATNTDEAVEAPPRVEAVAVETGRELTFDLTTRTAPLSVVSELPSDLLARSADRQDSPTEAAPTSGPTSGDAGESFGIAAVTQSAPIEQERYCSVPRNDPGNQAYQPKPRQVEWAVDRAVKGELTERRLANWRNLGMPEYRVQQLFPRVDLSGGGTIPPQIVLGVLMQESNLWQASRFTTPGNTGNPLIGDFYGYRSGTSIWDIDYTEADCGYGVGQITDGMRLAGHERTDDNGQPIETALPYDQQRAIALDYAANIAKSVQMLAEKWNEVRAAGMQANNGTAANIENWYFAVWAYNTGFHPYVDEETPWGVGWFNNPINKIYSQSRHPFLTSQGDASHPQDWPYPEKVIGWAAYGTQLVETQLSNPETRTYQSQWISSYRTASWGAEVFRSAAAAPFALFCDPDRNECDPNDAKGEYCQRDDSQCWWHYSAQWQECPFQCGLGFERFPSSDYPNESDSMLPSLPPLTLQSSHPANCTSVPAANALIVDDTTQPSARNPGECSRWATTGSFAFTFSTPDANGNWPARVDLHQQGGGFNAHFYFAHMQDANDRQKIVSGTWQLGTDLTGQWTRVWVHLPDYAAWTQQAAYTIDTGNGATQTRYLPQRRYQNEWVSLGVFEMAGDPSVTLTNELTRNETFNRGTWDMRGYDDVAWDSVAFEPLDAKPDHFVVALGDSYASGEGAEDYFPWSDNNGTDAINNNACHQSKNAWIRKAGLPGLSLNVGHLADSASPDLDFQFLACSGAETEDLLPYFTAGPTPPINADGQTGYWAQYGTVSQLDAGYLDENTTLVTLAIGGNDMGFGNIIATCVLNFVNPISCKYAFPIGSLTPLYIPTEEKLAISLPGGLAAVVAEIASRAPNAAIAVVGYPWLFENGGTCLPVSPASDAWLNELAEDITWTMQTAVQNLDTALPNHVFFVDPQPEFSGHNLCAEPPALTRLQFVPRPGEDPTFSWLPGVFVGDTGASQTSVHPNGYGTDLYANALDLALALNY